MNKQKFQKGDQPGDIVDLFPDNVYTSDSVNYINTYMPNENESSIDWIFDNGDVILESPNGASISALANCFGLTNLFGTNGEGFVYYQNALMTLSLAAKFLKTNDKEGWLKFCKELKLKS